MTRSTECAAMPAAAPCSGRTTARFSGVAAHPGGLVFE